MRTTLDLDERALVRARAKADLEGISLGKAVSRLILEPDERVVVPAGFPMFPPLPPGGGTPFTDELVAQHRDD